MILNRQDALVYLKKLRQSFNGGNADNLIDETHQFLKTNLGESHEFYKSFEKTKQQSSSVRINIASDILAGTEIILSEENNKYHQRISNFNKLIEKGKSFMSKLENKESRINFLELLVEWRSECLSFLEQERSRYTSIFLESIYEGHVVEGKLLSAFTDSESGAIKLVQEHAVKKMLFVLREAQKEL